MAHALQVTRDIAVREPLTDSRRSGRGRWLQDPPESQASEREHWQVAREPSPCW
jgi:hypothetical protein